MLFGLVYLLAAALLGRYAGQAPSGDLSAAFFHANIDALVNISGGYAITRMPFVGWVAGTVSALMIAGAFLHSGMLYAAALGLVPSAAQLMPLGLVALAGATVFVGIGFLGRRAAR